MNKTHYLETRKSVKVDSITSFNCVHMELNTLVDKLSKKWTLKFRTSY